MKKKEIQLGILYLKKKSVLTGQNEAAPVHPFVTHTCTGRQVACSTEAKP